MNLLSGGVVFIDDEINDADSAAYSLLDEISSTGRPVTTDVGIPNDYKDRFAHWKSLAFVIIDWDLTPGSIGLSGGDTLSGFKRRSLYQFLEDLMAEIYCPIFIVSGEDVGAIRSSLSGDERFADSQGVLDSRIEIFSKDVVLDHLVEKLSEWVESNPALSALKAWEKEHDAAKNRLFRELTSLEPNWPSYIWQAAVEDQVDPAYELTSVISTNLVNRLDPISFEIKSIVAPTTSPTAKALRQVSQGRTSVDGARLSPRMVLPGDLFILPDEDQDEIWMNVSPACHTVGRTRKTADDKEIVEEVRLHLIRGTKASWPKSAKDLKNMDSKDRFNSIIIHTLLGDDPYKFTFGDARLENWIDISESRVARLLSPYVTKVQQLHSAYMQSEGLPRVTFDLYSS